MAFTTTTPNMNLVLPTPSQQGGPQWAIDINACLTTVDTHDHTPGYGVPLTPASFNINSDLPLGNNNLTAVRTVRFQSQASQPIGALDIGCIYENAAGDLQYINAAGTNVPITLGNSIVGTAGSISGLPSGTASASYNAVASSFVFQSATNVAALVDGRSFILRNSTASSKGLTLSPPAAMASDYGITLPPLPAATNIMIMTSGGAITASYSLDGSTIAVSSNIIGVPAGGITATQLASNAVTTAKITDGSVTTAKIANANVTLDKMANDSVGTSQLIAANVTLAKMANNSVGAAQIIDGNVGEAELADDSVTTAKLVNANVTQAKLANSSVGTAQLIAANVTAAKMESSINLPGKNVKAASLPVMVANGTTSTNGPAVAYGYINGSGALVDGTGLASSRSSAGVYTITWTLLAGQIPTVLVTPLSPSPTTTPVTAFVVGTPSATGTEVRLYNTGTLSDEAFSIIVIGQRA